MKKPDLVASNQTIFDQEVLNYKILKHELFNHKIPKKVIFNQITQMRF